MSDDPLAPVWARLDSVHPVFFHPELVRALDGTCDRLVGLGVLKETAPSLYGQCPDCGNGHLVRAVWVPNPGTGRDEPRLPCPTCGPVRISADHLRRWVVDVPELLARVCSAAGIKAARAEVVPNHLWFVGTAGWGGRSHQVYFVRATHARNRETAVAALGPRPGAILLHPTEHAVWRWGAATPNRAVALESVVGLGPDGLTFAAGLMADRLADARGQESADVPIPKRASRAANIARLTESVIEHLRGARDHAFATRELSARKEPQLLRRPTLKKLGELAGLEPYEVTRCFQDETARELNLYWEMALDIDAVMSFRGPISIGPSS